MPAATNDVVIRHQKQLAVMRGWLDGRRYYRAIKALELMRSHESGTRKDGFTPKAHHQLSIARLLSTLEPHFMHPEDTMIVAFLHDDLEDHSDVNSLDQIRRDFGDTVASGVWSVTKKCSAVGVVKTYESYFGCLARDPIGSIVKLADRAHNYQTMPGVFSESKQREYLAELDTWFLPLVKEARRNFPSQYPAYENLKILLRCQAALLRMNLEHTEELRNEILPIT